MVGPIRGFGTLLKMGNKTSKLKPKDNKINYQIADEKIWVKDIHLESINGEILEILIILGSSTIQEIAVPINCNKISFKLLDFEVFPLFAFKYMSININIKLTTGATCKLTMYGDEASAEEYDEYYKTKEISYFIYYKNFQQIGDDDTKIMYLQNGLPGVPANSHIMKKYEMEWLNNGGFEIDERINYPSIIKVKNKSLGTRVYTFNKEPKSITLIK